MAITLGKSQAAIVVGGQINSLQTPYLAWSNPLSGATKLTVPITIRPDPMHFWDMVKDPVDGSTGQAFITQQQDNAPYRSTYWLQMTTPGTLSFTVLDGDVGLYKTRTVTSSANAIVPGQWNRLVAEWQASDGAIRIWNNGVDVSASTSNSADGAPSKLTTQGPFSCIEAGYATNQDRWHVVGDYAEWAGIPNYYAPDAECVKYGQGYSPGVIWTAAAQRGNGLGWYCRCHDLGSYQPGVRKPTIFYMIPKVGALTFDGVWMGSVYDEWRCHWYGVDDVGDPNWSTQTVPVGGVGIAGCSNAIDHPPVNYAGGLWAPSGIHVPEPIKDYSDLPEVEFQRYEVEGQAIALGAASSSGTGYGKRSGVTHLLSNVSGQSWWDSFGALNWGDDLVMTPGAVYDAPGAGRGGLTIYGTPATTDTSLRTWPLAQRQTFGSNTPAGAQTLAGTQTPKCLGCAPSYRVIRTSDVAGLPTTSQRAVTMPDGSLHRISDPAARVGKADTNHMGQINTDPTKPFLEHTWLSAAFTAQRVAFHGINIVRQNPTVPNQLLCWFDPAHLDHILFNQCLVDGDPLGTGHGLGAFVVGWGQYMGLFNSALLGFSMQFADGPLQHMYGPGPVHFENLYIESNSVQLQGGEYTNSPVTSDITYRSMHHIWPYRWNYDGMFTFATRPYTVTIPAADGLTAHRASGFYDPDPLTQWNAGLRWNPNRGGYLVDPATGIARQINYKYPWDVNTLYLKRPWPNAPVTTPFQATAQRANVIYNSGAVEPSPVNSVTNGTNRVTFTAPLPATVWDEDHHPGEGHYFFQNNISWNGVDRTPIADIGNADLTPDGVNIPRQLIQTIDANRLGCTLAAPYGQSRTFPFTISPFDGIRRVPHFHGKGWFETKQGQRILAEGNVVEGMVGGNWQHPSFDYWAWDSTPLSITITGNTLGADGYYRGGTATMTAGLAAWPQWFVDHVGMWRSWGGEALFDQMNEKNSPYAVLASLPGYHWGQDGYVDEILSPTTLRLGKNPWPNGAYPNFFELIGIGNNHWTVSDCNYRYNVYVRSISNADTSTSTLSSSWPGKKGKNDHWHDNLHYEYLSDIHNIQGQGSVGVLGMMTVNGQILQMQHLYGNGTNRYTHTTTVRGVGQPDGNQNLFSVIYDLAPGGGANDPTPDNLITDNIFRTGENPGGSTWFGSYNVAGAGTPYDVMTYIPWSTSRVARNLAWGGAGPKIYSDIAARWPENAGLLVPDSVGFVNKDDPDPTNVVSFALQHVATSGTVTIANDGLSATLASGTFPNTVVAGQYFRTDTAPLELKRITSVSGATVFWGNPPHSQAGQNSKAYAITFKGTATDGTDPGANIAVLSQFVSGVRQLTVGLPPTLAITTPATNPYSTTLGTLAMSGTATDDVAVTSVTWVNDRGGVGTATLGSGTWSIASGAITLQNGTNNIAITAHDGDGNQTTVTQVVTANFGIPPTVQITTPTSAPTFDTTVATVSLAGTASDDSGTVTSVTWSTDRAVSPASGPATGTANWSVASINLLAGTNTLTVSAFDPQNNRTDRTLVVTYTPPPPPETVLRRRLPFHPSSRR